MAHTLHDLGLTCPGAPAPGLLFVGVALGALGLATSLILIANRHGVRAREIVDLEWSQVEFGRNAKLHMRRVKGGVPSVHPLRSDEIRALRKRRTIGATLCSLPSAVSHSLLTPSIARSTPIGVRAALSFSGPRALLRHACSSMLVGKGHSTRHMPDWLGHASITHTLKYTAPLTERSKDFWRD
jgi:integrase